MLHEGKSAPPPYAKHADGLPLRTRDASESVAGRIEHQRSAFCKHIRMEPEPCGSWQTKDQSSGSLMDIRLDSGESACRKVLLSVAPYP